MYIDWSRVDEHLAFFTGLLSCYCNHLFFQSSPLIAGDHDDTPEVEAGSLVSRRNALSHSDTFVLSTSQPRQLAALVSDGRCVGLSLVVLLDIS